MRRVLWRIFFSSCLTLSVSACAGLGRVTSYDLGVELQDQGKFAAAIEHYKAVLAHDPQHLQARFNLAVIYHDQHNYQAAKRQYKRLLHLYPDHARSLINLADIADAEGHPSRAYILLLRAVDAAPTHAYPYSYLGWYLQQHGRLSEAQAAYERALALKEDALTHYRLGRLRLQQGNVAAARIHFSRAIKLDPNDSKTLYQLALLTMAAGQYSEAERYLQRLTHLTPHQAKVFTLLGKLYLQRGQYSTAALHLWEARDLQPGSADIERLLLQVYEKLLQQQRQIVTHQRDKPAKPAVNLARDGTDISSPQRYHYPLPPTQ